MGKEYNTYVNNMTGSAIGDGATVINRPGTVIVNPPAPKKQASTLDAYLEALIGYCNELPYISLPGSRRERPPLSTLYVRRRVRQQEEEPPEAKEPVPRRQPTVEAMRAHPSLVLLGEPGAGKSTWAYHTARQVAQTVRQVVQGEAVGVAEPYLPLLVRLGLVAASGERDFIERLKDTLEAELSLTLPDHFFTTWPRQAKCKGWLLICDGLDEVRDERMRLTFVQNLERLAAAGHHVLITSRPGGYERTAPRFPTFELEPFTPEEAETFLRRWFEDFLTREEAEAKVRGLLETARRRHLTGLLANPLLVTVMAVVYHEQGTLATRRPALYREFIEVMLHEAKERGMQKALEEEGGLTKAVAGNLITHTPDLLARVALAMQQRGETEEEALAEALVPFLQEEMGKDKSQQRTVYNYAIAWLRIVRRWSGVLVQRGRRYEFLHPTFREYLAARALAEAYGSDPAALWAELEPHLLEEEWAEVIPLTLAHLEDATPLGERLLEANAEDWTLQRSLFHAAAALAEGANVTEDVKRRVIDNLAYLAHPTSDEWDDIWASDVIAVLEQMGDDEYAAEVLCILSGDHTDDGLVEDPDDVVSVLVDIVRDNGVEETRRVQAMDALIKMRKTEALLILAQDKYIEAKLRLQIIMELNDLSYDSETIVDLLLSLAQDATADIKTRMHAVTVLAWLGHTEKATSVLDGLGRVGEIVPELFDIAQDEEMEESLRTWAADILRRWGYKP